MVQNTYLEFKTSLDTGSGLKIAVLCIELIDYFVGQYISNKNYYSKWCRMHFLI